MYTFALKTRYILFETTLGKWISIVLGSGLLFTAYLSMSRAVIYNSDNASILLQAQAMHHGNLLLQGWSMPTDDFLTNEIPLYALGLALGFSMPALLHIVPAFLYILLVLTGGYLASLLLPQKQRLWSVVAFVGIVAFPASDMAGGFLIGPVHLGTVLFTLLGLIAYWHYLHATKRQWLVFALLLLLVLLAVLGDPFALVLFVVPLVLTESLDMLVKKRLASFNVRTIISVLGVTLLAFGIRQVLNSAGVHILLTAGFSVTDFPNMLKHTENALLYLATIFHANIFTHSSLALSNLPFFLNMGVVLILMYATVRWCLRSLFRAVTTHEKMVSVLTWSMLGILAAYIVSTLGITIRYLYPLLFFGGVASFAMLTPWVKKPILLGATLLVFVMNSAAFAVSLWQAPTTPVPEAQLMTLLQEHHLTQGLGTYWVAPIVTVQSQEHIVLRQVVIQDHSIHPYVFLADEKWFHVSNMQHTNFIVYRNIDEDNPQAFYNASVHSFGVPDHQYRTGIYIVLAWDTPLFTHMQPGSTF